MDESRPRVAQEHDQEILKACAERIFGCLIAVTGTAIAFLRFTRPNLNIRAALDLVKRRKKARVRHVYYPDNQY